jgi:hypothetical protein
MTDLALTFGGDLQFAPGGDILLVSGSGLTEQRVLRRLLTNKGDYIWHLNYGGGLSQVIGQPGEAATIAGVVRSQLFQETRVAAIPAPQVSITSDQGGTVGMTLQYVDGITRKTNAISTVCMRRWKSRPRSGGIMRLRGGVKTSHL